MRRIATYLVLSLFLSLGTGQAFADRSHDRQGHRTEQRDRHDKKQDKKHDKRDKHDKKQDKWDKKHPGNNRPGNSHPGNNRPGNHHPGVSAPRPGSVYHPAPHPGGPHPGGPHPGAVSAPRPGHGSPVYYNGPMPPRLQHMVHHASRGGKIVNVWRVDYNTYVVQYRKGRKYYTQYIYPYADRYGAPALINVNWAPPTPWSLIPAIQLNINL